MLRKSLLAICIVGFSPSLTFAQTTAEVFQRLWTDYMAICGPTLDDPYSVLANRAVPPGYESLQWFGTEDGADVTVNYASSEFQWLVVIEIFASATQTSVHCSVNYGDFEGAPVFADTASTLAVLWPLINQVPGLATAGGEVRGLTPEDDDQIDILKSSIVFSGAFPEHPTAIGLLTTDEANMGLEVNLFLEPQE